MLPTPSIRVPQHEQLPALQPFGGRHDVFTPRPDLTSLPLYLPAAFDNQRLLRQDAPYQVPAQIMAEMMRWLQPTTTQDGVQVRMTPLGLLVDGPMLRPGPTSAIRRQLCTSSSPTLVLPPTMATDHLYGHLSTSSPHPRDVVGLAYASSTADDRCIPCSPGPASG